jgi:hypothetical protein
MIRKLLGLTLTTWLCLSANAPSAEMLVYHPIQTDKIRLRTKPSSVWLDYNPLKESRSGEGFEWRPMERGGLLVVRREKGN